MVLGRTVIPFGLLSLVIASTANGQTYAPGQKPSVNEIVHVAVEELPAPQTRTIIGIGEDVSCSIDESSWSDPDDQINGSKKTTVYDKMGQVKWSASGAGTVYPIYSTSTTLTADLVSADDTVTVEASIVDAGLFALDYPPGGGALVKVLVMQVVVPAGCNVDFGNDTPNFGTKAGAPKYVASSSNFDCQIIPATANFSKVSFQENIPKQQYDFPDGIHVAVLKAEQNPFTLRTNGIVHNYWSDLSQSSTTSELLWFKDAKTGKYEDFSNAKRTVPLEFKDKTGAWNSCYKDYLHSWPFVGKTQEMRSQITGSNGTAKGGLMGPWDSIP